MPLRVDDGLLDYMAQNSDAIHVQIRDITELSQVSDGLERARGLLFRIPHPDQPDEPFPSFVSEVELRAAGATFWFDMSGGDAYPDVLERALQAILTGLEDAGVDDAMDVARQRVAERDRS